MVKKLTAMMLALTFMLMLMPAMAQGEEMQDWLYYAVVANPNAADRLNLRAGPDAASESLGRFYSGTPVTVCLEEEAGDQTWAYVNIGGLYGYMLKDYLMEVNRNYGAPQLFYTASPVDGCALRAEPDAASRQLAYLRNGGTVCILGDIGDDWRYVRTEEMVYGYVRTNQLKNRSILIEEAYLGRMNDTIPLYADKEMKRQIALYYPGATCQVTDLNRQKGYAYVEISGMPHSSQAQGRISEGYISLEDLLVFAWPWQVSYRFQAAEAREDCVLMCQESGPLSVKKGTVLTVIGEAEDWYHVCCYVGEYSARDYAYVERSRLSILSGRGGDRFGPDSLGYAWIDIPRDEDGWQTGAESWTVPGTEKGENVYLPLSRVIGRSGGYLQLSQPQQRHFFIREDAARIIERESLFFDMEIRKAAGEWTADESTAGLWFWQTGTGEAGEMTLENEALNLKKHYTLEENTLCFSVYIPEGTRVTLTGGTLNAMTESNRPLFCPRLQTDTISESEIIFQGSGRYFCPDQIQNASNWLDYVIEPMPGAEESYIVYGNLFAEGEDILYLKDAETEGVKGREITDQFVCAPGAFLELHNCIVRITYGNG